MLTRRPAVFMAREGVLTESDRLDGDPRPQHDVARLRLLPGVTEACRLFREARLLLVVVTNQPEVSRGHLYPSQLTAVHRALADDLPLDDIAVCIHDDDAGCPCRMPRPGMILDAARRLGIDLDRSVSVGGRWHDVESAGRGGVSSAHVDGGRDETLTREPDASSRACSTAAPGSRRTGHRDLSPST